MLAFGASFCDVQQQQFISGDPYFEPTYFKWGQFSGRCAALFPKLRVPKVLSPEEASFVLPYQSDHDIVIANVFFKNVLYVARIPLDAKLKVSVVKEFFRYPASHGTLLFEFEDPRAIELIPQSARDRALTKSSKFLKYLSYNLTGVLAEGDPISLGEAFLRHKRVMITRVIHAYSNLQEFSAATSANHRLEVFPLAATSAQASRILAAGIRHAVRRGYSDVFSGLNRNCIYDMFSVIDKGLGSNELNEDSRRQWWDMTAFFHRLPFLVESLLEKRNLWKTGESKMFVLRQGSKF